MTEQPGQRYRWPVEPKVRAGALGAATAGFVLWLIARYVFHADVRDLPGELVTFVMIAVPGAASWLAGYLAPHMPRTRPPRP